MLHPHTNVTLIHSRASLLSSEPLPAEFSSKALDIIRSSGINTIMGARVNSTTKTQDGSGDDEYTLTLSTGETLTASHVINAVSRFTPTAPNYLPEGICDEEGYIRIKPTLEFPSDASLPAEIAGDHYAAGDVARWSGIKRGGAAMHQGHYAARNIHQKMMAKVYGTTPEFMVLEEVQAGMGIALGETALSYFPSMGLGEGKETKKIFFEDDLGFMSMFIPYLSLFSFCEIWLICVVCYRWMQLAKPMPGPVEMPASEEKSTPVNVASNPTPVEAAA